MECEYCGNVIKTYGALKKHQNTAKYCLAKQNRSVTIEHVCNTCDKKFTIKSSLNDHLKICKANIPSVYDLKELLDEKIRHLILVKKELDLSLQTIEELKIENSACRKELDLSLQTIEELKIENSACRKELDLSVQTIEELRKENSEYRKDMFTLASKSVTNITNKTTHNIQNLIVSDWRPEVIEEKVEENFKLEHVEDGLKGVARFTSKYITSEEDGVRRYHCTDRSREVFVYKDSEGVIQKDIGARKLKNAIKEPIIKKSTKLVAEERSRLSNIIAKAQQGDDVITSSSLNMTNLTNKFQEIKHLDENISFSKEMAVLCT